MEGERFGEVEDKNRYVNAQVLGTVGLGNGGGVENQAGLRIFATLAIRSYEIFSS